MLISHVNLAISAIMFTGTTYMMLFAALETPLTISRCVSKASGLWVYTILMFIQFLAILVQMCLAAILSFDPDWAQTVIAVDIAIFVCLLVYSQNLIVGHNGMF